MEITSKMIYEPKVNAKKCTDCGICVRSCPGHRVDFEKLNNSIFGMEPRSRQIGNFIECYVGHSNNDKIRYDSSSGGLATQLLLFALENDMIDGALVTRMRKKNPTEPETFIARSKSEIIESSKSKYCPVAANVGLKQILREKGRYAVVGLPCHIHGVRKAESESRDLSERITLHIGLLCSHMTSFAGLDLLLKKLRIGTKEVAKIDYRGQGWPGSMVIEKTDGQKVSLPLFGAWKAYWPIFSSFFFTPLRCAMCPDQAAELADVSFGDAWLPEFKNERIGKSIIVVRTKKGYDIMRSASAAGSISLRRIPWQKLQQSQKVNLVFKKKDLANRLLILGLIGRQTPRFTLQATRASAWSSFVRSGFVFCNIKVSGMRIARRLLINIPFPLFRIYYGIYKYLSYL
jgi:coenzyme F420 hydrogenase subunit beta